MLFAPTLSASRGRYVGGIITPSGYTYYYGSTLPDNFVALVKIATNKSGNEYVSYAMEVLKDTIYDSNDLLKYFRFPVVRYTSRENAKKLALNSIGYPCKVLNLLGAKFVRYLDNSVAMYEIEGEYLYCTPSKSSIISDPNQTFYVYHIACFMALYPSKFVVRDGKVYYGNEVVIENIKSWDRCCANPKYALSWENMFEILCSISKVR
ncbi:conserved hypothetical protein [Betalipothrixvirus acidiani]|uniref:Uncharacterized protein n=1 Tax=Betalipothrixvirus acidiani TaxID=346881 RepID=A7WK88_9VIRU|nr:hypothetical protein AFV3_gp66 [Acidianus filamentous virus 3]CAL69588.1 conserved hypothetical protein [Acidianus filamentous virus 3]